MLSYFFYFFLAFMLYQLVFKFILPVYRTTRRVRRSFQEMQERMGGQPQSGSNQSFSKPHAEAKTQPAGDYIDFEEVKEK